jgi:hypothetical protein
MGKHFINITGGLQFVVLEEVPKEQLGVYETIALFGGSAYFYV